MRDVSLLRRVAAKDRDAFEELYGLYYRRIYGYLLRVTRRQDVVEEVLNDVLFVVWTDAAKFKGDSRVSSWIFGIAYRKALKALERSARHAAEPLEEMPAHEQPVETAAEAHRRELRLSLDRALEDLTPEHRAVVELTYFEDCSYQEVAEIVGCPVNTVKTRMFYARERLREILPRLGMQPA